MTFLQAALAVLESAGRPLTVDEITAEVLGRRLTTSAGKTPSASLSAVLYVELRDNPKTRLVRQAEPGQNRARRGSVRWTLRG